MNQQSALPRHLEERLVAQHGELIAAADLAALLKYSSTLTLRRAVAAKRVPVSLKKIGNRYVSPTREVARYLITLGVPDLA